MKIDLESAATRLEQKFILAIALGHTPLEAAKYAGYKSPNSAAREVLTRPIVRAALLISRDAVLEAIAKSKKLTAGK